LSIVAVVVLGNPGATVLGAIRSAVDPAAAHATAFFPLSHVILHSMDPLSHAVKKHYGCVGKYYHVQERMFVYAADKILAQFASKRYAQL
jgi:hypothetical protein